MALLISVLSLPAASALCFLINLFRYCHDLSARRKGASTVSEKALKERRLSLIISSVVLAAFIILLVLLYIMLDNSITYQYQI